MKISKNPLRVARTPYGQGLFATKNFRRGQTVAKVDGEIIVDAEYGSEYCIDLGEDRSMEPASPYSFLNHCCEPNCELVTVEKRTGKNQLPQVLLDAVRTIRAGEQLTIDYRWAADAAIPCLCGSSQCRGWIVDPEEIHLLPSEGARGVRRRA